MNKRRISAMLLIIAGIIVGDFVALIPPAQLEARNNSVVTTGQTMKPMNSCEVACGVKGGVKVHAGGSGVIHVGS